MLRAARRTLGLRFQMDTPEALTPGPLVVIGRHVSHGDALLPILLFGTTHRLQLRYVIARGLTWVPSLDVFGHRLRNHFVDRAASSGSELAAVARLAEGLDHQHAAVIFPEGQFFTADRRDRILQRIARDDSILAERVSGLRHVLPPRLGGVLTLLNEAPPGTDVVVLGHVGFEGFSTVSQLWRNVPMAEPVLVRTWRHATTDLAGPGDRSGQVDWVLRRWEELDAWIEDELARRAQANGAQR